MAKKTPMTASDMAKKRWSKTKKADRVAFMKRVRSFVNQPKVAGPEAGEPK